MTKIINTITHSEGFSLIEIIVASAISALMMLMIYSAYRSTLSSIKDMTGYAELYENINLAVSKIDHDLTNTYIQKKNKNVSFICELEGENSKLNFVTAEYQDLHITGNPDSPSPFSDIHEVGYYLREDKEYPGLYFLIKRDEMHYDDQPETGGMENIILENVVGLNFDFKSGNDWVDNWDSRETKRYPTIVRTTIKVKKYGVKISDRENTEEFQFLSQININ